MISTLLLFTLLFKEVLQHGYIRLVVVQDVVEHPVVVDRVLDVDHLYVGDGEVVEHVKLVDLDVDVVQRADQAAGVYLRRLRERRAGEAKHHGAGG